MNKKYLAIILFISGVATIIYALLGGFKSPEYSTIENTTIKIYGTYYEGTLGSDSLRNLFLKSRDLVKAHNSFDAIAIVYFGSANEKNGQVINFIGVHQIGSENPLNLKNWETWTFKSDKGVKACIEANVLAMPTPEDMLTALKNYGNEQNIKADSIFIEYYKGPNNLCVELFSK